MDQQLLQKLENDPDGLLTYEDLANHIDQCPAILPELVDTLPRVDSTGQFMVSAARYLSAIDLQGFRPWIDTLVAAAIDRDREHRYIADLLPSIWGEDFAARADELSHTDNNFRRIYKRVNPAGPI